MNRLTERSDRQPGYTLCVTDYLTKPTDRSTISTGGGWLVRQWRQEKRAGGRKP
ncbi:hypothetical protein WMW72_27430 [Paenibacillus filicis]|uniref:Uncharacterized protein n=1 Tax=Paenibacillus filicis TaxID=669464 RepID=A0ABU9DU56_9BACL